MKEMDEDRNRATLYGHNLHRRRKVSLVGKIARLSKIMGLFGNVYMPTWSEEHFHIKSPMPKKGAELKLSHELGANIKRVILRAGTATD